jgi:hypothetical protein
MKIPVLESTKLSTYQEMLADKKATAQDVLALTQSPNQKGWKQAEVDLIAKKLIDEILSFAVEQRKDGRKYFLKIKAPKVSLSPCFRFDSDGPSHTNAYDDIPLPLRSIPTPHFQRFDEQGRWIAYRTAEIDSPGNELSLRTQMDYGLKHFCEVAVIESSQGGLPLVKIEQPPLIDLPPNDDPHSGIKFT